jgi:putative membrane protein
VTSFAPGVLAVVGWIGAFVTYLVRRALPARALAAALPAHRVALAGWWPAVALGLVQAALLWAMLGPLGVTMGSPAGVAAFLFVPVLAFTALNQCFVALRGRRRGWLALILFTVVQVVSLAGPVPLDTAPPTLQAVSGFLPVSLAAEGVGVLTLEGQVGSVAAASVGLLGWSAAALAVTVLAARRRQRRSLADVRRRVAGGPASHAVG